MTQPITVILNAGSGNDDKKPLHDLIIETIQNAGRSLTLVDLKPGDDFERHCTEAVKQAKKENGLVIAAGGDGTVSGVAALCHKHDVLFGVIPLGTFNYFARELHISTDPAKALEVVLNGITRTVAAGFVQDRLFLNNASFGLYTKIIRNREKDKSRFGRLRIVALLSAIHSLFTDHRNFTVRLNGETRRTAMVFIGNNTLQLDNLGMDVAECTQQNRLAVVVMRLVTPWETFRILLRGMLKNLQDEKLESFCTDQLEVESARRQIDLVVDGEIIQINLPLTFRVEKNALRVMVPKTEAT